MLCSGGFPPFPAVHARSPFPLHQFTVNCSNLGVEWAVHLLAFCIDNEGLPLAVLGDAQGVWLTPLGHPSGDSSIVLVFLSPLPSEWKLKVAPSVRWLQSRGPDLPAYHLQIMAASAACAEKRALHLLCFPFCPVHFRDCSSLAVARHLAHCEDKSACFL